MTEGGELAIRLQRAAFNRALAEADLAAIGPLLAPDAVLVTGSDSAVLTGRRAQLQAWKREFSARTRTIYIRTPDAIDCSPVAPIALEQGHWEGRASDGATIEAQGRYSAKWRLIGGAWVIVAEIFVTMG